MEEILASIRRIISEDEDETRAPQTAPSTVQVRSRTVQAAPVAAAPIEVAPALVQPQPVSRAQPEPQLVARPAPETPRRAAPPVQTAPQFVQPATQPLSVAPAAAPQQPAPRPAPQQVAQQVAMSQANTSENMLSDSAVAAASKAFQSLGQKVKVAKSGEGKSLEEIVTEMLRPMVKEWLEAHLGAIVEEKVEAEVKRLARQGQ